MTIYSSPIIDHLFTSTFDTDNGAKVTFQSNSNFSSNSDSDSNPTSPIEDQLGFMLDSVYPGNLHRFPNIENYTIIPLFVNRTSRDIVYTKPTSDNGNDDEDQSIIPCYLYTVSYYKHDGSDSANSPTNAISIITTLPIFEVFKPLLCYLLHQTFNAELFDCTTLDLVLRNLNNSHLNDLLNHFDHLNPASRFVLTRTPPDFSLNESLKLSIHLLEYFTDSNNLYKTSIYLDAEKKFKFPIQIPKSSIIASSLSMFGIDLKRTSNIKNLILTLNNTKIIHNGEVTTSFKETCLTPYANIRPLHVLLNALILKKKIIIYTCSNSYNNLIAFANMLYLIYNASCTPTSDSISSLAYFPSIRSTNVESLHFIHFQESYLIGTSNLLLKDQMDWNIFLDLDSNILNVKIDDNKIDEIYFTDDNTLDATESDIKSHAMASSFSSSNVSYIDSFHADNRLHYWDPLCFPRIILDNEKIEYFLHSNEDQEDQSFKVSKFPLSSSNTSIPRADRALDAQIDRLVENHHDDETLFILLTNYLRNLTTRILPAFYHFTKFLQIRDYRAHLLSNNHTHETTGNDQRDSEYLDSKIRNFIQENHIIQPFPLNFPFNSNHTFLDDPKIVTHYSKIAFANVHLLKLAVHYNSIIFKHGNSIPGFMFSWSGGEDNLNEKNVDIRLDTHYLISILDRMIDGTSNESWQLDKYLLLQIFKTLNSILKIHGTGANGLSDVLVDLFIEKRGDESFARSCGIDLTETSGIIAEDIVQPPILLKPGTSIKSEKPILEKFRRLAVSPGNVVFLKNVIHNNNNSNVTNEEIDAGLSSSSYSIRRMSKSRNSLVGSSTKIVEDSGIKNKTGLSTQHHEADELLSHVGTLGTQRFTKLILVASLYMSIRGPEDIVETKKGIRRKDLLMNEFKRFLSGVLNDTFFKEFVLVEMDDFIKLTVNDFIDYHM